MRAMLTVTQDFTLTRCRKLGISVLILFLAVSIVPRSEAQVRESAKAKEIWVESEDTSAPIELGMPSFAPIIDKLGQAVVNISTRTKAEETRNPFGRNAPSPFDLFSQFPQQRREMRSLGSGFVIHPDGYIVTNNHVVENASKVRVTFKDDKRSYDAKVIGSDSKTDLALLKVDSPHKLASVVVGDSDAVKTGDWVIAIGNPFLLGHTATVGIVSATARRIPGASDDFIQTDASINPGNSGGPLFNSKGEVIGVNTAIFSPGRFGSSGFNIGIGFAIPIRTVKSIISELHAKGKVTRGWLGVLIQPVSPDAATALNLSAAEGALVADVMNDSPASKGGVERGDVIVRFNGHKVSESEELPGIVARTPIGSTVVVEVLRRGKPVTIKVKIEELREGDASPEPSAPEESKLGIAVQDLTPEIARSLGIDTVKGVIVTNIVPGSVAEEEGLVRGDVILELNGSAVETAQDFRKLTSNLDKDKPLLILINRNNNTLYLTLRPER